MYLYYFMFAELLGSVIWYLSLILENSLLLFFQVIFLPYSFHLLLNSNNGYVIPFDIVSQCSILIWSCMLCIFSISAFNILIIIILNHLPDDFSIWVWFRLIILSLEGISIFFLHFHMPHNFCWKLDILDRIVSLRWIFMLGCGHIFPLLGL